MNKLTKPSRTAEVIINALLTDRSNNINCPTTGELIEISDLERLPTTILVNVSVTQDYLRHVEWMGFYYVLCSGHTTHERSVHIYNILGYKIGGAYSSHMAYKLDGA